MTHRPTSIRTMEHWRPHNNGNGSFFFFVNTEVKNVNNKHQATMSTTIYFPEGTLLASD